MCALRVNSNLIICNEAARCFQVGERVRVRDSETQHWLLGVQVNHTVGFIRNDLILTSDPPLPQIVPKSGGGLCPKSLPPPLMGKKPPPLGGAYAICPPKGGAYATFLVVKWIFWEIL